MNPIGSAPLIRRCFEKITTCPRTQVFRFADIDHTAGRVFHQIDAGYLRKGAHLVCCLLVKRGGRRFRFWRAYVVGRVHNRLLEIRGPYSRATCRLPAGQTALSQIVTGAGISHRGASDARLSQSPAAWSVEHAQNNTCLERTSRQVKKMRCHPQQGCYSEKLAFVT